jgi:cell division septal protein FtsQ
MVFCGAGDCFVIDEKRESYEDFDDNAQSDFIILTDRSSKEVKLGEFVLDDEYMNYVIGIKNKLGEINLETENKFSTTSFISKDIQVKTKEDWEIYFNQNISLEKEIEMLKVVLENKIEEGQRKDLEYIDLRIDNKIYYKFREGTPSQIAKEATEVTAKDDKKEKD